MSVESDLHDLLEIECPRVFPDYAPPNTTLPYVTYQKIGGRPIVSFNKDVPNKIFSMFQINVWSATRLQADALAWSIDEALRTAIVFDAKPETDPVSVFEDDAPNLRGTRQDFSIISNR